MTRRIPRPVRGAIRFALSWAEWYTSDLEPAIAGGRRDEIASDVWEQAAGQADRPAAALAASIAGRVVRGIPADLAWRWRMPSGVRRETGVVRAGLAIAVVLSGAVLALGVGAVGRTVVGLLRGEALPSVVTVSSAGFGVAALLLGFALVLRPRTRRLGFVWLAFASALTLHFSALILVTLSASFQSVYYTLVQYTSDVWLTGWFLLVGAISAFPALVALALAPTRVARA
jgi:hypothetical protein